MSDLRSFIRLSGATSALAIACTLGAPAFAQQTGSDASVATPATLEPDQSTEIVVTAQKRSERLQDVPLAVTAVSGEALANRQVNDTTMLTRAVPSLTFQQGPNPTNTTLRIRGVGTALFGQGVESSVSVVVDGVVQARQAQGFADLADIERVEVLRGPQGTLFGKNASAGVISIVTARPSQDFEGRIDGTIAEHGEYRTRGTVSGPLTDTLRARVTGFYNDVRGITYNTTRKQWVNGQESWGVRGKLEWEPTDTLTFLLSGEYRKTNSDCCIASTIQTINPIVAALEAPVVASPTNRQVSEDTATYANSNQKTFSLQADWDLGPATLTSITAYQDYYLKVNQPIDRINSDPVRFVGAGAAYASWNFNQGILDLSQFSQELRIGSNGNSDFTYVAGVFYSHTDIKRPFSRRRAICTAGVIGQACPAPRYQSSSSFAELKTDSIAAFGQAEYKIVGGLSLLGGLRVQYEKGTNFGAQLGTIAAGDALLPGVPANGSGTLSDHDTAITGKAGLKYEFSRNLQAYGTYTRGYKGIGYNMEAGTNFTTQSTLSPENVNAYELGLKGRTADGTLSLAIAAYRADYSNLQVQANRSDPVTGVTQFVATNAGKSRSQGVEVEATLRPSRNFSVDASIAYTESTVDIDGLNCPLQLQAAAPVRTDAPTNLCYRAAAGATPQQNLRNATLPASPKVRISFAPRWDYEISETLGGFAQVGVSFQSKQQFAIEQDPLLVQEAYTLVDASVGIHTADRRYSLSVFVKNLFDVNYYTAVSHNSLLATAARPFDLSANYNKDADRYFGATLGMKF
ncbi:TonB-dependent receptor [Sphingobium sp.]|uniref:TonB-dependent receptor n=1 Tax=Sphingobium sp. TaxID=1912891 RepID=UPI003BB588CB